MKIFAHVINDIGVTFFGVVLGWVTYRTLRRQAGGASISDIASVIGAVVGTTITGGLFSYLQQAEAIGLYLIGLTFGFFGFYILSIKIGDTKTEALVGKEPRQQ